MSLGRSPFCVLYSILLAWTLWQGTYESGSWSPIVTYATDQEGKRGRAACEERAEQDQEYWDGRSPNAYTFVCVPAGVNPDTYHRMGGGSKSR